MPKLNVLMSPDKTVIYQFFDDNDKLVVAAAFDKAGATDIARKTLTLADLIPEDAEATLQSMKSAMQTGKQH